MSGSHFSDFINRTSQEVINAPRSGVIGWWVEQTATAIDQTREDPLLLCLFALRLISAALLIPLTLGIRFPRIFVIVSFFQPPRIHKAVFIIIKGASRWPRNGD